LFGKISWSVCQNMIECLSKYDRLFVKINYKVYQKKLECLTK
jgi:hypothetical protein